MRPFEWALLITAAAAVWTGSRSWLWPLGGALIGHAVFEWPRVQLATGYAAAGWALWNLCSCEASAAATAWTPSGWGVAVGLIGVVVAGVFASLMPIGRFDALLTGPYKRLGVLRHTFIEGRADSGSESIARVQSRAHVDPPIPPYEPFPSLLDVTVKVYYPSDTTPVPLMTRLWGSLRHALTCRSGPGRADAFSDMPTVKGVSYFARLPTPLFAVMPLATTPQALLNAPIAKQQDKFPVILFCHGLGGCPDFYTTVAQDYASHGYIVVMPTFLDRSAATALRADGSRLHYRRLTPAEDKDEAQRLQLRFAQVSERAREALFVRDCLLAMAADVDRLDRPRAGEGDGEAAATRLSWLIPRMALDSLVIGGHSFGGATSMVAVQFDAADRPALYAAPADAARVKTRRRSRSGAAGAEAVANGDDSKSGAGGVDGPAGRLSCVVVHDVWMEPLSESMLAKGMPSRVPVLAIESEQWLVWKLHHQKTRAFLSRPGSHRANALCAIVGSRHSNFADVPLFSPLVSRVMGATGRIDVYRCFALLNDLSIRFIRTHRPSPLPKPLRNVHSLGAPLIDAYDDDSDGGVAPDDLSAGGAAASPAARVASRHVGHNHNGRGAVDLDRPFVPHPEVVWREIADTAAAAVGSDG